MGKGIWFLWAMSRFLNSAGRERSLFPPSPAIGLLCRKHGLMGAGCVPVCASPTCVSRYIHIFLSKSSRWVECVFLSMSVFLFIFFSVQDQEEQASAKFFSFLQFQTSGHFIPKSSVFYR